MMDSFFTSVSAQDTMSLQEMLDMDAGDDIDEIFSFDLHKLPTINLDDDSLGAPGENNVWLTSDGSPFLGGDVSNGLGSDLSVGETRMVCPNSVMPVTLIEVPYDKPSPSPKQAVSVKSAPSEKMFKAVTSNVRQPSPVPASDALDLLSGQVFIKEEYMEDDEDYRAPTSFKNFAVRSKSRLDDSPRSISSGVKRNVQSIKTLNGKRRVSQSSTQPDLNLMPSIYPKPAYSYSCLIAMALKNSPSGSLPVSEIYNFMCEHFPYFKTAPNGWKNSVRHNLSLNKCFEKIEKPATNGSQRKGCLWAMNPNKVNKMDEEVQKWSKKDKSAIRKSMIYPESLDALERGQLVTTFKAEPESDDDQWDENLQVDDDDEEEEDDEEMEFVDNLIRVKEEKIEFDGDSDLSLTDVDLEMAETIYAEKMRAGKLNVQVKVSTSPNGFKPLLSGAYTVNSQGSVSSPKRLKTLGSSITGNYVYKPLSGAVSLRRKSPVRHSLLSSLEADD